MPPNGGKNPNGKRMMMGRRTEPMIDGDEIDALTEWHHVYGWKSGTRKAIKRKYNKRVRRKERKELSKTFFPIGVSVSEANALTNWTE